MCQELLFNPLTFHAKSDLSGCVLYEESVALQIILSFILSKSTFNSQNVHALFKFCSEPFHQQDLNLFTLPKVYLIHQTFMLLNVQSSSNN